ncbi:MAG: tellurium resistance protein TerC [Chloroflexi bacterium HGW-Chloroflexi-8]|jgi:tellurite resistance protein TerC|nr:MAG: tellurium resistance protein TerC [Chloroflexi bacterium HGW-Chloroflexi-8]
MDWSIIVVIIQLIFLEGILSIDNAAILGAMVTKLPEHEPIPWPKALSKLGHILDKPLGFQRMAALRVGLIGAYAGRGIMLLLASIIVQNPWLKIIGAIYLIRLALDDLGAPGHEGSEDESMRSVKQNGFWITVLNVELMDLAFSLDNVVAAVSLSSHILIVMLGVAIGILVMRFAAGIFSYVVEREPILKQAAYVLVLNIGIELMLEEFAHIEFSDWLRFGISISTIVLAMAYAHLPFMKVFRPLLIWLGQGFSLLSGLISWILLPIKGFFSVIAKVFQRPQPDPGN